MYERKYLLITVGWKNKLLYLFQVEMDSKYLFCKYKYCHLETMLNTGVIMVF